MVFSLQVFLGLVQETNLIQRLINVAYTYDNLAHRYWDPAPACIQPRPASANWLSFCSTEF